MCASKNLRSSLVALIFIRYYLQTEAVMSTPVVSISTVVVDVVVFIFTSYMFAYLEEFCLSIAAVDN